MQRLDDEAVPAMCRAYAMQAADYQHVTPDQLAHCCPGCPDPEQWARAFDDAIEFFDVRDVAMLLAQVGHESQDLTRLEESLWYTPRRLIQVWPSRFPNRRIAEQYARNPEALANNVYGGRMGNDKDGDGWLFRGRGPIQLTGRYNYQRFADAINSREPLLHPDSLLEPDLGALSATWFYLVHVPNGADIETATRRINGGTHGLGDRQARFERCVKVFS